MSQEGVQRYATTRVIGMSGITYTEIHHDRQKGPSRIPTLEKDQILVAEVEPQNLNLDTGLYRCRDMADVQSVYYKLSTQEFLEVKSWGILTVPDRAGF